MTLTDVLAPVIALVEHAATQHIQQAEGVDVGSVVQQLDAAPMRATSAYPASAEAGFNASKDTEAEAAAAYLVQRVDAEIGKAQALALRSNIMGSDFEQGLFAALAWADEKLLASPWVGARRWSRHLLQKKYFNTTKAGVEFFDRLYSLPSGKKEVREVYALCLALGFSGRYGYEKDVQGLRDIRMQLNQSLGTSSESLGAVTEHIFPDAYKPVAESLSTTKNKTKWALGLSSFQAGAIVFPIIVLVVLAIIYYYSIELMVSNIESVVR